MVFNFSSLFKELAVAGCFRAAVWNYSHFVVIDNILTKNRPQPADWPLRALFSVGFQGLEW